MCEWKQNQLLPEWKLLIVRTECECLGTNIIFHCYQLAPFYRITKQLPWNQNQNEEGGLTGNA